MYPHFLRGMLREAAGDGGTGGGGGGTPPPAAPPAALPPAADLSKILADFKASLLAELKPPPPKPEPPKPGADAHDNAALLKRIADMETERSNDRVAAKTAADAARDRDRIAQIRTHLSGHALANDAAAEDALNYFGSKLKFNDSDQLVTPDGTPVKDWIGKTLTNERAHLLKPRDVGGAGAANGGAAGGGKTIDIDDIKPGMSAEQMKAVEAQLARMMRGQ